MSEMIIRNILLMEKDCEIINSVIEEKGLGKKGFSAAIRLIVREWDEIKHTSGQSTQIIEPEGVPV